MEWATIDQLHSYFHLVSPKLMLTPRSGPDSQATACQSNLTGTKFQCPQHLWHWNLLCAGLPRLFSQGPTRQPLWVSQGHMKTTQTSGLPSLQLCAVPSLNHSHLALSSASVFLSREPMVSMWAPTPALESGRCCQGDARMNVRLFSQMCASFLSGTAACVCSQKPAKSSFAYFIRLFHLLVAG